MYYLLVTTIIENPNAIEYDLEKHVGKKSTQRKMTLDIFWSVKIN